MPSEWTTEPLYRPYWAPFSIHAAIFLLEASITRPLLPSSKAYTADFTGLSVSLPNFVIMTSSPTLIVPVTYPVTTKSGESFPALNTFSTPSAKPFLASSEVWLPSAGVVVASAFTASSFTSEVSSFLSSSCFTSSWTTSSFFGSSFLREKKSFNPIVKPPNG